MELDKIRQQFDSTVFAVEPTETTLEDKEAEIDTYTADLAKRIEEHKYKLANPSKPKPFIRKNSMASMASLPADPSMFDYGV